MPALQRIAEVHITAHQMDALKRHSRFRRVVHRNDDAADDLRNQHNHQNAAERVECVQVARNRI